MGKSYLAIMVNQKKKMQFEKYKTKQHTSRKITNVTKRTISVYFSIVI